MIFELFLIHGFVIDSDILVFVLDEIVGFDAVYGFDVVLHIFLLVIFGFLLLEIFSIHCHARPAGDLESYVLRFSLRVDVHCIIKNVLLL